ncbi:putative ribonuclease P [Dioscorea sansibarensis]
MVQFKNRYMVMEVFIDPNRDLGGSEPIVISQFNLTKAIKDSILLNFGECSLALSLRSFQVKYVNPVTKVCVIRTSRDDHEKIWAAITMVRSIGKCPITFNLLDLSGCIRACKAAALKCDEAKFETYKLASGGSVKPEIIHSVESCFEKLKNLES